MEVQDSTFYVIKKHSPIKMRRSVRDTVIASDHGLWSLFECRLCQKQAWCKLDDQRPRSFICDGRSIVTVLSCNPLPQETPANAKGLDQ